MNQPMDRDVAASTDSKLISMASDLVVPGAVRRRCIEVLYGRYAPGLYRHCKKMYWADLRSSDALAAFVGEVFMRFIESGRFDPNVAKRPDEIQKLVNCWLRKQAYW